MPTMAPMVKEGDTLGEIHHKYNKLVNDAIKNNNIELTEINYDDSDIDNLFKIDIASNNRNVEFILKVLQSTDMLFVSRAIKKSPWLITDKQYAHVINPVYLFHVLRLQMSSKAFNKIILQIRLLLRDEERVEGFYNHYKERDFQTGLKWLPHCSQPFIEKVLENDGHQVTNNLLKRLCEKSIQSLDIYCRYNKRYYKREALFETMFLLKDDVERYLDIIETMPYYTPTFKAKYTKIIMTKCRNRIMKNLDRYAEYIDVPTFAKCLSEDEIKDLILKNIKNENFHSWFRDQKVKHLIHRLPFDERFEFIKKIFIDKEHRNDDSDDDSLDDADPCRCVQSCGISCNKTGTSQRVYTWYKFAPFKTAFTDLKKLIRTESNANERIAILTVLWTTAGENMQNIQTLFKYYQEHHINENLKFKFQFIYIVLSKTRVYRYDKNTWNYLKDIFSSMEVYSESDKNVQSCVRSVLLYCVINDETVPEIIETKFEFSTLKQYKKKLSQDEQNKLFNYLLTSIFSKLQNDNLQTEKEYEVMFNILENALSLLCDWDKDLKDYPAILEKIKHLIEMNKEYPGWEMDIKRLFNKKKSWKKLLFAESLLASPAQDTVMNALKHDAKMIEKYKNKIYELLKDNKNLDIFFKKIRIYWSQSLANSYKELLIDSLPQSYNHKPIITGLCNLLPHKHVTEIIKKCIRFESKINWSKQDKVQLYVRKYLAMELYLARPQPSLDMGLLYAKGDYLQYALPSLNAIPYNMSSTNIREILKTLLNAPVSLQRHCVRVAILKMKPGDLQQSWPDIWNSNKNSSVRADIFLNNHNMLCKEKNEKSIRNKWELLKIFINNLTPDEDPKVYITLSEVENVPMSIRGEYWMNSYEFFNSLSSEAYCDSPFRYPLDIHLDNHLDINMTNIMHFLDADFVANIYMPSFDKQFCTQDYAHFDDVAKYLLSAETEEAQMIRYNKIFVPMFEKSLPLWDKQHEGVYHVRNNIFKIIKYLINRFYIVVGEDMVFPIKMFTEILDNLQTKLPRIQNYILITIQKLGLKYITIMDKIVREEKDKQSESAFKTTTKDDLRTILHKNVILEFGKASVEYLKEDVAQNFSSIYYLFAEALDSVLSFFGNDKINKLTVLNAFLGDIEFITGYLLVLKSFPRGSYNDKEITLKNDILNKIGEHPNKEITMHYSFVKNWTEARFL